MSSHFHLFVLLGSEATNQSKWRQDGDVMAETLMDSKQAAKYQNFEGIHKHELV